MKILDEYDEENDECIIIISTYASVKKIEKYYENFSLVIMDECHHGFSDRTQFLQERQENLIKLTATLHNDEDTDNIIYTVPF